MDWLKAITDYLTADMVGDEVIPDTDLHVPMLCLCEQPVIVGFAVNGYAICVCNGVIVRNEGRKTDAAGTKY